MPEEFTYGGNTIFSHPIFIETILPFLLVFTVVFAILQKSKILGEGKKQIDAIVALSIGLIVVAFGKATGIILQLIPFLVVSLIVLLILMMLLGFTHSGDKAFELPKGLKYAMWAVSIIAVIIAVLYITDGWRAILGFFLSDTTGILVNIVFIAIIIGAIIFVMRGDKGVK